MTPSQLRYIFNKYSFDDKPAAYKTWTQVERLVEWPPGTSAVFMMWNDTIIVGANYDEETRVALYDWRIKYSMNKIAKPSQEKDPLNGITENNPNYLAWQKMFYEDGMGQSEIARILGVSPAYCSNMKRKFEQQNNAIAVG